MSEVRSVEDDKSAGPPAFRAGAAFAREGMDQAKNVQHMDHTEAQQWWLGFMSEVMGAAIHDIGSEAAALLVKSFCQLTPHVAKRIQQ